MRGEGLRATLVRNDALCCGCRISGLRDARLLFPQNLALLDIVLEAVKCVSNKETIRFFEHERDDSLDEMVDDGRVRREHLCVDGTDLRVTHAYTPNGIYRIDEGRWCKVAETRAELVAYESHSVLRYHQYSDIPARCVNRAGRVDVDLVESAHAVNCRARHEHECVCGEVDDHGWLLWCGWSRCCVSRWMGVGVGCSRKILGNVYWRDNFLSTKKNCMGTIFYVRSQNVIELVH